MAGYSRTELQILGGQFNLLPPPDKVPITDYLLCQNFRPDRIGKLVSRYGFPAKFQIPGIAIAHSAAVMGGPEGSVYVAGNTQSGQGLLYFNFTLPAIASSFDGNRVAMVPLNGWMWFMNAGLQGRHSGSGPFEIWNLAPPTTAPIASAPVAGAVVPTVTYNYTSQGDPAYVHSLTIQGTTYQFSENGYSAPQIPLVIKSLASSDPNCTVTYSGTGTAVVITPIPVNTLIRVSGSDGNPDTNLGSGTIAALPLGTYQYYVTFATADDTLESNPSPASSGLTVISQAVILTNVPVSTDPRVGKRNIYASGGTLGQAYLVGTINDNTTTTITIDVSDLEATNNGVVMPVDHDAPPPAAGMVGPYYGRLIAFAVSWAVNRLFWTDPGLPQYWPGAADDFVGNWVDVGEDGEKILWCTVHTNILIIYKEKSIWRLLGDPDTGELERMSDGVGLVNAFACVSAGPSDYFVGPNGLYRNDLNSVLDITRGLRPLFDTTFSNSGRLTPPGSIIPGPSYFSNSLDCYGVALGYAMGKLYIAFNELTSLTGVGALTSPMLIYHEASDRWMYYRNRYGDVGWKGFYFDGVEMVGLTGSGTGEALGWNVDDFQARYFEDDGNLQIECVYQSHYEDAGQPDSQKAWLEVVVDCELLGDTATVYVGLNSGIVPLTSMGTITGSGRQSKGFALAFSATGTLILADAADPLQRPCLAKNLSVAVECLAHHPVVIHNVYLYYYEEARLAISASTLPTDLGVGKVKQCKELELDIDPSGGVVKVNLYSDLPGNALAVRQTPTVAIASGGRAIWKYPFPVTEGFLWRIALLAQALPFRLYAARLLMRVMGVYVEAYEAAAGFVWDSQELSFESGITHIPTDYGVALSSLPIKRFREISLEIDTFNAAVTLNFLTDLPGNQQSSRFTGTVNTGSAGRRYFRLPLPAGTNAAIEGRFCRLQLSGAAKFVLYQAAVEILPVGVYVEAYEAAAGAVWDSREQDFGTPAAKEARELELDIETTGLVNWLLYGDAAGPFAGTANTTGRQKVMIPLTISAPLDQFVEFRLARLILTGTNAFRLYGARIQTRAFGQYLSLAEGAAGALWDSTELDLGTQSVKQFREVELDISATGGYTVVVYTDLPGNAMAARITATPAATSGRTKVQIPLPQGSVPDNYMIGRLVRVTVQSTTGIVKLFGARIGARAIGVYIEAYEASGGAVFDSREMDLGTPAVKEARELELDVETTGVVTWQLLTDMAAPYAGTANTTGRQKVMIPLTISAPLDQFVEFRMLRLILRGTNAFRLYGARIWIRPFGQYLLAAETSAGALWDSTELDLGTQTVKQIREVELDLWAYGAYTVTIYTDLPGNAMAVRVTVNPAATSGRTQIQIPLQQGGVPDNYFFGRLVRVTLTSASSIKLFGARVHARAIAIYVEAYEAAGGAVWDSFERDLGSLAVKQFRELQLEIGAAGAYTVTVYTDLPGNVMTSRLVANQAATTGRTAVVIPLPQGGVPDNYFIGRLIRVVIASASAFQLYDCQVDARAAGFYVEAAEGAAGAVWDSSELDLGTQTVKQFREVQLEIGASGAYTVKVYTDLPGNVMTLRVTANQAATTGRTAVQIPLPQGNVPDNYIFGRLVRVVISSASAFQLYQARIDSHTIGVYVESYEAAGGAVWDSLAQDLGNPNDKTFDQIHVEMDSDGAASVAVYTDLPGETFTTKGTFALTTAGTSRHWATVPLPAGIEGRSVRLVVSSTFGFRIYKVQVRAFQVGRYLCARTASNADDKLTTLDFDFRSERRKLYKKIEVDMRADVAVTLSVLTEQSGQLAEVYTKVLTTPTGRAPLSVVFPPGLRGRLLRLSLTGGPARIYHVRVWDREVTEPGANWAWNDYPLEQSDVLPAWVDLPVEPTPPAFSWSDLPVPATPPTFTWAEMGVTPTADTFIWSDLPVQKTNPEWQWANLAVTPTPNEYSWSDLPVAKTEPAWAWAPFPVAPTAEWFWARVLSVEETPDTWKLVDIPFGISGS